MVRLYWKFTKHSKLNFTINRFEVIDINIVTYLGTKQIKNDITTLKTTVVF